MLLKSRRRRHYVSRIMRCGEGEVKDEGDIFDKIVSPSLPVNG
jgi:hypothetical protein